MVSSSTSSLQAQAALSSPPGRLRRFFFPVFSVLLVCTGMVLGLSRINLVQADSSLSSSLNGPGIATFFTPEVQAWEAQILSWSEEFLLDPNLVATVMQIESCGYVQARSGSGAMGLFQVMPYHFQEGENPYSPDINANRGLHYLRMALESGGSPRLALAGYNGGITGAQNTPDNWPEETRRYVYWGVEIFQNARDGLDHSSRLDEWLSSGGASLCKLAADQQD